MLMHLRVPPELSSFVEVRKHLLVGRDSQLYFHSKALDSLLTERPQIPGYKYQFINFKNGLL
jgi:hypothetical protein